MERGRFITLEGGEGAGKSTQVLRLAAALRARGLDVVTTREPGGSPGAEEIRRLLVTGAAGRWGPMTELLLLVAARRDHLERTVWPALDRGAWVISDRFGDSTLAYQGYGHGLDRTLIAGLQALGIGDFAPDLTVVIDIPPEAGLARALARSGGADRYEALALDFHRRLRQGFLEIARAEPERCAVVDGTLGEADVGRAILDVVGGRLALRASR